MSSDAETVCAHCFQGILRARQIEQRLVVYVGRVPDGTTKAELRERFEKFGEVTDISIHFREWGLVYIFHGFEILKIYVNKET